MAGHLDDEVLAAVLRPPSMLVTLADALSGSPDPADTAGVCASTSWPGLPARHLARPADYLGAAGFRSVPSVARLLERVGGVTLRARPSSAGRSPPGDLHVRLTGPATWPPSSTASYAPRTRRRLRRATASREPGLATRLEVSRGTVATPSHQFPLGVAMSFGRRMALSQWADHHDALVIEDDYDSEFRFTSRPLEPLVNLDPSGRVCDVGSFSKTMLPSLRLGSWSRRRR